MEVTKTRTAELEKALFQGITKGSEIQGKGSASIIWYDTERPLSFVFKLQTQKRISLFKVRHRTHKTTDHWARTFLLN